MSKSTKQLVAARKRSSYVQAVRFTREAFTLATNARQAAEIVGDVLALPGWSAEGIERTIAKHGLARKGTPAQRASVRLVLAAVARLTKSAK